MRKIDLLEDRVALRGEGERRSKKQKKGGLG